MQDNWTEYFDEFGCIACGKTESPYAGHGLCQPCRDLISRQLDGVAQQLAIGESSHGQV